MTKMTMDQKQAVIAAASTFVSKIYESSLGNCLCNLCLFSKDAIEVKFQYPRKLMISDIIERTFYESFQAFKTYDNVKVNRDVIGKSTLVVTYYIFFD